MRYKMSDEKKPREKSYRICLASDFFFPNIGGVEAHIYSMAYCLASMGHKIVIITRERKSMNLTGVRYYTNGIKVYYIPATMLEIGIVMPMHNSTLCILLRHILLRERIEVIHGHQKASLIVIIMIFLARIMDIPYVVTQHSLFDFNDVGSVELNRLYRFCNRMVSHSICVSNTVRENAILSSFLNPGDCSVIPNALDSTFYHPRPVKKDPSRIKVVVFSRMTFRKGVDLLLEILPIVCHKYPNVVFAISGDGPKRPLLESLVKEHGIESQVEIQGFTEFTSVPSFLSAGDIFLNVSVSEAFCMAILEAAACGLYVVSTDVGGIPEILPSDQMTLCKPESQDMLTKLSKVIDEKTYLGASKSRDYIKESYDWFYVAEKTVEIYDRVVEKRHEDSLAKLAMLSHTPYMPGYFILLIGMCFVRVMIWIADHLFPRSQVVFAPWLKIPSSSSNTTATSPSKSPTDEN